MSVTERDRRHKTSRRTDPATDLAKARQAIYVTCTMETTSHSAKTRGRPRSFDRDTALERAMLLFWRQGYAATSISELTAAMGINPPSLYACFGSKEGLFKAVLEHYDQRRATFMASVLEAPSSPWRQNTVIALSSVSSLQKDRGRPVRMVVSLFVWIVI